MGKQLTHDEFIKRVNENASGKYTFLEEYKNSNTKIKTQCNACNYIWYSRPADIMRGHGCPVCAGKIVLVGYNDLKTIAPNVCEEWDYKKNNDITPEQLTSKSDKKVWWKCHKCGNEWQAIVSNRTAGSGCPICARVKNGQHYNQLKIIEKGTLEETRPDLLLEWDYDKNTIDPSEITAGSNKKVWWKCSDGHSWIAPVYVRNNGCGCSICARSIRTQGSINTRLLRDGSFADNYPEFVKYWDFELNDKSCYEVTKKSKYIAHWCCPDCGYTWTDRVGSMAKGTGCPNCVLHSKFSVIQKMTESYIDEKYNYEIKHENNCSIYPRNPKTNYPMPYDNEVIISDDSRLIIEVHGEQHYKINIFIEKSAKDKNVSPQKELEYVQWKDSYKKQYALDSGYFYLELPYWTFPDESYKKIIDQKIQQILNGQKGEKGHASILKNTK